MKDFIFTWPVLSFLLFFAVQLFALEPLGVLLKPQLGEFATHVVFILRILIVAMVWKYLMADWSDYFRLDISNIPLLLTGCLLLYAALFFPWPLPSPAVLWPKVSLHILISTWEELLLRGLLLTLLLKAYPNHVLAVLVFVGGLFGLLHLANLLHGAALSEVIPQIIWSCALGLAFAVITYQTGSLVPAILLHCGYNLIPAVWDGKPWLLAKADSYGNWGIAMVAMVFVPLVLVSLWTAQSAD